MTTEATEAYKCPICNEFSQHVIIMSTNAFGSMDLDTRPPEMQRSTIFAWVQECPHCGYVAHELSDEPSVDAAFLKTPEYVGYGGIAFQSNLAKKFYRLYLINANAGDASDTFWAALHAAWASDDAEDEASAIICRKLALDPLDKLIEQEQDDENLKLLKLDVLRRAKMFDEAIQYAKQLSFQEEFLQKIANLEVELTRKRDASCHTVAEV